MIELFVLMRLHVMIIPDCKELSNVTEVEKMFRTRLNWLCRTTLHN